MSQLPKTAKEIRAKYHEQQEKRDYTITHSRELEKISKHAIHLAHEEKITEAKKKLQDVRQIQHDIQERGDENQPSYKHALEEYVEARSLLAFQENTTLPTPNELSVDEETYYAGLSDLTGELARLATRAAIKQDHQVIKQAHALTQDIHAQLLQLTLRNNHLRKKADSVKYNRNKLEQLQYEQTLRNK